MKTLKLSLFAAAALFVSVSASAQEKKATNELKKDTRSASIPSAAAPASITPTATSQKPTGLTFKEESFNFGDIEKGKPVTHEFSFKNTSKETILITSVKASCGCTTPNWTKEPIKPGESGTVTATYNAANPGPFTKTVTVTTNDTDQNKILVIKGKVIGDTAPAPAPAVTPAVKQ